MIDKKRRLIELSWKILEAKFYYYQLDKPIMADADYDKLEKEYDGLCEELNIEPTATDMVGFSLERPSCRLIADHYYLRTNEDEE